MSLKTFDFGAVALCAWLLFPASAEAQLYTWRDASGTLVVSQHPKDPSAKLYVVRNSPSMRTTRAAVSKSADAYEELIERHATEQNISADLIRAVIQAESAFNPGARSIKGAMGLMQLMPATARELGVMNAYDPAENIRGGVAYLKQLLVRYNFDLELALAAYNAGPGAVERYGAVPPYRETRNYVHKVRNRATAGGNAPPPPKRLYRIVETIDGKSVVRYSDSPSAGATLVTPYGR